MTFKRCSNWLAAVLARRRRALLAALVALLVVLAGWGLRARAPTLPAAAAHAVAAPGGTLRADVGTTPPSSVAARPPRASLAAIPELVDADAELARRMKADWCGFGAAERQRQREAVHAAATTQRGSIDMQALEETSQTVGGQVMAQAVADVRRRWVQALVRRGDDRSLAIADYLEDERTDDAMGARVRLQARARRSTDPMVTALALQRPCASGVCVNVDAAQWSRLEPGNLQAWLALMDVQSRVVPSTQAAYALDRLAQEARYSRSYQREMYAVLSELPQTPTLGLANEAETTFASSVLYGWPLFRMRPLLEVCRSGVAEAGTASRCEAVARLALQQDDWLHRSMGLGIARALVAARPGVRPQWEASAQTFEAVRQWADEKALHAATAAESTPEAPSPCAQLLEARGLLHDTMTGSEWERSREGMPESGLGEAALAARWRGREGRSVLDPIPVPRPASAPAKVG